MNTMRLIRIPLATMLLTPAAQAQLAPANGLTLSARLGFNVSTRFKGNTSDLPTFLNRLGATTPTSKPMITSAISSSSRVKPTVDLRVVMVCFSHPKNKNDYSKFYTKKLVQTENSCRLNNALRHLRSTAGAASGRYFMIAARADSCRVIRRQVARIVPPGRCGRPADLSLAAVAQGWRRLLVANDHCRRIPLADNKPARGQYRIVADA